MPKFCVTTYTGKGTDNDPYRPAGADDYAHWGSIDFRPDIKVLDGFVFMAVPDTENVPRGSFQVSESKIERLSASRLSLLSNRLGLNLTETTLDFILLELLTNHATPPADKTRWNPIAPTRNNRFEIWLMEKVLDIPFVHGGTVITESFNKADSTTLGPDLTWSEISGNHAVFNNQLEISTTNTNGRCRAQHNLASSNNYGKATISTTAGTGGDAWFVYARFAQIDDTAYFAAQGDGAGANPNTTRIFKVESSTQTILTNSSRTRVVGDIIECRADGTSISMYVNGSSHLNLTDSSITTGVRTGIGIRRGNGSTPQLDNFEGGDLQLDATTTPSTIAGIFAMPAVAGNSTHLAAAISRSFAVNAPTVQASSTAAPSAVSRAFTIPAPTVFSDATVSPSTIAMTIAMPAPEVTGDSVVVAAPAEEPSEVSSKRRRGSRIGKKPL